MAVTLKNIYKSWIAQCSHVNMDMSTENLSFSPLRVVVPRLVQGRVEDIKLPNASLFEKSALGG